MVEELVVARWLHLAGSLVLFGAALFPCYAPAGRYLDRPLRRVLVVAAGLAVAAALAQAGLAALARSNGTRGLGQGFPADPGFGPAALTHLGLACVGLVACVRLRRNSWTVRPQARILVLLAAAVLVTQPLAGPRAGAEAAPAVASALRLLAEGAWLGGIASFGALLFGRIPAGPDPHGRAVLARLSRVGLAAAGLIAATRFRGAESGTGRAVAVALAALAVLGWLVAAPRGARSATLPIAVAASSAALLLAAALLDASALP